MERMMLRKIKYLAPDHTASKVHSLADSRAGLTAGPMGAITRLYSLGRRLVCM